MDAPSRPEHFFVGNCSMRCSTTDIPVGVSLRLIRFNQSFLEKPRHRRGFVL